jgi:hypothetical protein
MRANVVNHNNITVYVGTRLVDCNSKGYGSDGERSISRITPTNAFDRECRQRLRIRVDSADGLQGIIGSSQFDRGFIQQ